MNKQTFLTLAVLAAVSVALVSCHKQHEPAELDTPLGPANCFVITAPGSYAFRPVKGNSTEAVGPIASTEVLWESFGTSVAPSKGAIVAESAYNTVSNVIRFKTPAALKNGNAVIAAKDASGNILWSWHVWVCEGWDPEKTAQTYYNNVGTMMDRNLGATSATPGEVESFGLLYQWGRKDPFLGSCDVSARVEAASTLQWPEPVYSDPETGTIAYAIAHPTTYIASVEDSYDWYYTGEYNTDNTRWQPDKKTIYDPCPEGWRLPKGATQTDGGVWGGACGKTFEIYGPDIQYPGLNLTKFFGDSDPIWYPFAGFRSDVTGLLGGVGDNAGVWSSTADLDESDANAKVMAMGLDISYTSQGNIMVLTVMDYFRAVGHSVRCVKEN